jgi:hypothetical protein
LITEGTDKSPRVQNDPDAELWGTDLIAKPRQMTGVGGIDVDTRFDLDRNESTITSFEHETDLTAAALSKMEQGHRAPTEREYLDGVLTRLGVTRRSCRRRDIVDPTSYPRLA